MRNIVLILIIAFLTCTVTAQKQDKTRVDKTPPPPTTNPDRADLSLLGSSDNEGAPAEAANLNKAAVRHALKGHYQEAIAVIRQVVSKEPDLAEPRLNLVFWLGQTNQYD